LTKNGTKPEVKREGRKEEWAIDDTPPLLIHHALPHLVVLIETILETQQKTIF
jgi:hypothetical protein